MFPMLANSALGLLGQNLGGVDLQSLMARSPFPQYGGDSQTGQMMNQYMAGLLSPRMAYLPPARQRKKLEQDGLLNLNSPYNASVPYVGIGGNFTYSNDGP